MIKAEDTRNSFGWRVMTERKQSGMSQTEVCDRLEKEFGIKITYGALSQIETGETKRFHIDILFAPANIFNVKAYTLLTGEERAEVASYSEVAEQIARMVDEMRPSTRQMIKMTAEAALTLERELLQEMAQMLIDDVSHLDSEVRKRLDDCIGHIGHGVRSNRQ